MKIQHAMNEINDTEPLVTRIKTNRSSHIFSKKWLP